MVSTIKAYLVLMLGYPQRFSPKCERGVKMSIATKNIEKILLTILAIVLP